MDKYIKLHKINFGLLQVIMRENLLGCESLVFLKEKMNQSGVKYLTYMLCKELQHFCYKRGKKVRINYIRY